MSQPEWPDSHQLPSDIPGPIQNLTNDGLSTYSWDGVNRLLSATQGSAQWQWQYNGASERVALEQTVSGSSAASRRYVWCDDDVCEDRETSTGLVRALMSHGESAFTGNTFVTSDHLGSARDMTTNLGVAVERRSYDPFGSVTAAGTSSASAGFAGQRSFEGAPVALTKHRAYSSIVARWLSEDPIELGDGPNMYRYVWNNPVQWIDPLGLQHQPGGPWHPRPPFDRVGCTPQDTCRILQMKISALSSMIRAHRNWDKKRGVNRHAQEIQDFVNAIENCKTLYERKCDTESLPTCKECLKVVVVVVGSLLWMCLTRLPAPAW